MGFLSAGTFNGNGQNFVQALSDVGQVGLEIFGLPTSSSIVVSGSVGNNVYNDRLVEDLSSGLMIASITQDGNYVVAVPAYGFVKIRTTSFGAGTVAWTLNGIPAPDGVSENFAGNFGTETRTVSGTKSITLTMPQIKTLGVCFRVSALSGGPIAWPQINVFGVMPDTNVFEIASFTPSGNASVTNFPAYLLATASASLGALWAQIDQIPICRVTRWDFVWTLPGATSITLDYDFFAGI